MSINSREDFLSKFDEIMRCPNKYTKYLTSKEIEKEYFKDSDSFIKIDKGLYYCRGDILDFKDDVVYDMNYSKDTIPYSGYYSNNIRRYPKKYDMTGIDSIAYVFSDIEPWNMKRLRSYNVSEVTDFTGTFSNTLRLNTFYIRDWNVSKGKFFEKMFKESVDEHNFKYLRNWDCSNAVSYFGMFESYGDEFEYDYAAISKMKINPNAEFSKMFGRIPQQELENFRNWFPDMDLRDIKSKLTGLPTRWYD